MSEIHKGGLPAGSVTNTPLGKAALQRIGNMTLQPGEAADAIQGHLNNFDSKLASFRDDYRVPSTDPNDTGKADAYVKMTKGLLADHKWMPNTKALLNGEIKATTKATTVLKDSIKMEKDMQGAELSKIRAEAKSKTMKKKASYDYNTAARNAIPDLNAAASKFDATVGKFFTSAGNFAKNVVGRHSELNTLHRELGQYEALAGNGVPGVNEAMAASKAKAINDTQAVVRRSRADAVVGGLGVTGIGLTLNDEIQRRKYAGYTATSDLKAKHANDTTSTHTTFQLSTERGNMAGDAMHALGTLDNDPSYAKRKLLAAVAVAAVSAGAGLYGADIVSTHPEFGKVMDVSGHSNMEMGKIVAELIPYVTGVGGAYYAYQNKDNARKRNVGLGVAGISVGASIVAHNTIPFTPITSQDLFKERVLLAGGMYSLVGATGYAGHKGQEIANHEAVEAAMRSTDPIEVVTHNVNTIRGRHSLTTKYPVTRYLNVPKVVTRLINSRMGKPAGSMSGEDLAYYREAQIDTEFNTLKKRYEANMGRLNHAGHTDLRQMAIDNVDGRA